MKLRYLSFLCFLMFSLNTLNAALEFDEENIVGNTTVNDSQYHAIYTFKNTGSSSVTIKDVKTSCGCTTVHMQKHTYEPGETGTIEVVFVFGYRRGVQHKDITIVSNEGVLGGDYVYALSLAVTIPEKYNVTKRSHHWILGSEAAPWSFTVQMHPDWKVKFDSIECRKEAFSYTYEENSKEHSITVTVTPKSTSEEIRDILNFYLDDGSDELKKISIFLSVREK